MTATPHAMLFVCDIQDGKLLSLVEGEESMRLSASLLVNVASLLALPVVVTEQVPAKLGYTHSDIKGALPPGTQILEKKSFSMISPDVARAVSQWGSDNAKQHKGKHGFGAILVGIETHVCILQTCLDLLGLGIPVHVVVDAVSSQRRLDKDVALRQMEQAGAHLTTAESLVFRLLGSSVHPAFRKCSRLCVGAAKARAQLSVSTRPPDSSSAGAGSATGDGPISLRLNTSNKHKYAEFVRIFRVLDKRITLDRTKVDLKEIDAAPYMVVAQKATDAGEGVLIEDTSLDVQGATVGVNVRWIMENLSELAGRGATWRVLLGVLRGGQVHIYEGVTQGTIVHKRGASDFGFDPVFQPDGSSQTLAEAKPDAVSARFKAIAALIRDSPAALHVPLPGAAWRGKWQEEH